MKPYQNTQASIYFHRQPKQFINPHQNSAKITFSNNYIPSPNIINSPHIRQQPRQHKQTYSNHSNSNTFQTLKTSQKTQSLYDINRFKTLPDNDNKRYQTPKPKKLDQSLIYSLNENKLDSTINGLSRIKPKIEKVHSKEYSDFQKTRKVNPKFDQYNDSSLPSYEQLLRQNQEMKQIIENQYLPMKKDFERISKEQQERDFLVAQLEWKVKQLAKQVKAAKNKK